MIEFWGMSLSGAVLASAAVGYLAGSIPFGLILTYLAKKGDVRAIGSGNIGATNVLRTGSRLLATAVLLLDAGKGGAAVFAAGLWGPLTPELGLAAGCGSLTGHLFPLWLRLGAMRDFFAALLLCLAVTAGLLLLFAGWAGDSVWTALVGGSVVAGMAIFAWGGKGVATTLGVLAAAAWPVSLASALTWLVVAILFRRSSLAALATLASAPIWSTWLGSPSIVWFTAFAAAIVFVRHQDNMRRLVRGKEAMISFSGSDQPR